MILEKRLLQNLADHARRTPAGERATPLQFEDADTGIRVELLADAVESLAGRYTRLSVRGATAPGPLLRERAETLADRVTGLLEPLRLLEIDGEHGVAVLRSATPTELEGVRSYHELTCDRDGGATLTRWSVGGASAKREPASFVLAHETLAKLVGDLGR